MSTALQRGQRHKPARPVANAADITEMVRGLIRYLSKAGMSPEAIREMKPYLVRFIEDLQSGKESLDGIPLPVHVGDAGAEPANVPPAAGRREAGSVTPHGMEYSVPKDLPYKMLDDPDPFDTVENLERRLAELEAMPDFLQGQARQHAQKDHRDEQADRGRGEGEVGGGLEQPDNIFKRPARSTPPSATSPERGAVQIGTPGTEN